MALGPVSLFRKFSAWCERRPSRIGWLLLLPPVIRLWTQEYLSRHEPTDPQNYILVIGSIFLGAGIIASLLNAVFMWPLNHRFDPDLRDRLSPLLRGLQYYPFRASIYAQAAAMPKLGRKYFPDYDFRPKIGHWRPICIIFSFLVELVTLSTLVLVAITLSQWCFGWPK